MFSRLSLFQFVQKYILHSDNTVAYGDNNNTYARYDCNGIELIGSINILHDNINHLLSISLCSSFTFFLIILFLDFTVSLIILFCCHGHGSCGHNLDWESRHQSFESGGGFFCS